MKKYFVLGLALLVLAAILFSFPWHQASKAGPGYAFVGEFESGRTVGAQQGIFWIPGVDEQDDRYHIDIPDWMTGWWTVTDGCQHFNRYWDGENQQTVDFCNPQTCECN